MKKQLVAAGIISAVGLTGAYGVASASAQGGDGQDGKNSMISKLVERFNLDESEVTTFFDEQQTERRAEGEAQQAERLASAVTDGTLTQAQADLIKEKTAEQRAGRETNKDSDLTREERQAEMETKRTEMQAWAEENGIPESFMGQGQGRGGPGGGHGNMGAEQE